LPADPSDSPSRETPYQSSSFRGSDFYFGYSTLKGKVTGWI
jgi:hypothetical protein